VLNLITPANPRNYWAYTAILCLFSGLIFSRSLYSVGLLLMALYWFLHTQHTGLWRNAWFISMLAFAALVPVFDLMQGTSIDGSFFIKLSLPLFPLFFFSWKPGQKEMTSMSLIIIVVLGLTALHSVINYATNMLATNVAYGQARVMQVGLYHDHIRISVAMALSIVLAIYIAGMQHKILLRYAFWAYAALMILFLHVLMARTGLVVLYVALALLGMGMLWQKHKKWVLGLWICLLVLPLVAYRILPSFKQRIDYARYDFSYYSRMEYRTGSSDGFRFYSWMSGWDAFTAHPLTGVGYKGLHDVNKAWFVKHFPAIKSEEIIQPSSEFLLNAAAAGVVGLLVFGFFALAPLAYKELRFHPVFLAVYGALGATWIFEILPENQYGIFVTGFFLSWAWWVAAGKEEITEH
jgi:O-antigen ligase